MRLSRRFRSQTLALAAGLLFLAPAGARAGQVPAPSAGSPSAPADGAGASVEAPGAPVVPDGPTARAPGGPVDAEAPAAEGSGASAPADLGALLREAMERNASIQAAAARLEAALRVPSQARTAPDPEAVLRYLNDGLSSFTLGEREFSELSLAWTQEVPYPGKLRLAGEVAKLEAERVEKSLGLIRLDVTAAVKSAYADLYRLDRTSALLEETRATLEVLAEAARRRYEVGDGIQESVLKAQTGILRVEAEIASVRQERRAAEVRLNAVVGRAEDVPVGPALHLPDADLPANSEPLSEAAVAGSPEIAGLDASVRRSEASLRLARLNLKPDFSWTAQYSYRDEFDPMIAGAFGVRLPVRRDRKQAQAVLQAESEFTAARQDLADAQVRLRAGVRDLVARARRADRLARLFAEGVVPQAWMALESARASYAVGRLPILDVLTDVSTLLEAQIEQVAQEAERFQALVALEPLVGRELVPVAAAAQKPDASDSSPREGEGHENVH